MTKSEFVWVLIRSVGAYFAYLAVITFFSMLSSGWGLIFEPPKIDISGTNANRAVAVPGIQQVPFDPNINPAAEKAADAKLKPEEKARREAVMNLVWLAVATLIYGGLSFYFLRDGRLLYALLIREESDNAKQAEPEVTTLNL